MIFNTLTPSKWRGQKCIIVARPIYVSNSHTKFGRILSDGLGEDSITDRRMNRGDNNIRRQKGVIQAYRGQKRLILSLTG